MAYVCVCARASCCRPEMNFPFACHFLCVYGIMVLSMQRQYGGTGCHSNPTEINLVDPSKRSSHRVLCTRSVCAWNRNLIYYILFYLCLAIVLMAGSFVVGLVWPNVRGTILYDTYARNSFDESSDYGCMHTFIFVHSKLMVSFVCSRKLFAKMNFVWTESIKIISFVVILHKKFTAWMQHYFRFIHCMCEIKCKYVCVCWLLYNGNERNPYFTANCKIKY